MSREIDELVAVNEVNLRKLDYKIAQTFFGWRWFYAKSNQRSWLVPVPVHPMFLETEFEPIEEARGQADSSCRKYSTDLSAAWEVVEKMRADGFGFEIRAYASDPIVSFYCPKGPCEKHGNTKHDGHEGECSSVSVPFSICVAALRGIGVPQSELDKIKETK